MGLLDDAIREHLELLRRRGADPTEIARAEAEALSPPVREVAEAEVSVEDDDLLAGTEPVPAPEPEEEIEELEAPDHAVDSDLVGDEPEPAGIDRPTEHFDSLAPEADLAHEEVAEEEEDLADPTLHSADAAVEDEDAPQPVSADRASDEVVEGQQDLLSSEGERADDGDVLEGTPDFLEDSPDHDKLWFEQSGPRDFDFDGDDRR